ncbi:MAG: hypothetical protein HZB42_02385 [Sphingobacteriales bacterium]|nr:hypothetical protein [Sphingobacteriales bacterium]
MKTILLFVSISVICISAIAQNTDLPSPDANLQTLPAGSYVIPMDNTLQTDNVIGSGNFNLKAYGLVVYLLNNDIKVKWVIKAGKAKDGIDFSANAQEVKPALIPGNSLRDFIAGPFVIFASDTTGVAALVDNFYASNSLTGYNRPRVFRVSFDVANVDIRYNLTGFKPKAAILTDGGKQAIHVGYMTACKIPSSSYMLATGGDLLTKCFTFASEPHNDVTGPVVNATISAIKTFVQYGGNFLAQCAAVINYENNSLGRFQTTTGITTVNAGVGTTLSYPNPDLGFSQFHGSFNASNNGSVKNWSINAAGANDEHNHATGTGANASAIGASVSKLKSGIGGLVFYVGNHEFLVSDGVIGINGIRMYMNAFLTPVSINNNCNTGQTLTNPLPVKLISFNAILSQDQSKVNLTWTTAQEMNASHFIVERSIDGITFNEAGMVFAVGNTNEQQNYQYSDKIANINSSIIYYRLRQVDVDGKSMYSETRIIRISKQTDNAITIVTFPNPVTSEVRITIPSNWQNKRVVYEVLN